MKVALQVERDKLHSTEESVCQKEKEVEKLKARKAAVEKDLVRARKMAKDLLDERVVVNAESEQQMEYLNERLVEFKQQAVLSEERLKQVQGLEGEHLDLKVQLKTLTTTLEDFQKVLTDEQKSRKSLDAIVKALTAEIDQLRTELKERDNEVSSLAAANRHLQRKVDAADANSREMKEKLSGARKKEQTLNDQLQEYRVKLKTTEGARDKFERSKVALEEEVAARDKQVRELTTVLAVRDRDLDKKEKELFTTKKDLVDAQAVVEAGESLEPLLRQKIEELEDEKRELMGVRDRLSDSVQTLESQLSEKEACCEELEKKRYEEAQNCQLMERERDRACKQADEVRRESKELYKEHDSLRIAHTQAQQKKKELSYQVMEYEQQMKAERAATAKERDSISLELVALRQEKRHLEENLEAKHQDLMSKQEELNVAESYVLGLQQRIEDLQEEYEVLQSDRQEKVHKLNELAPQCEEVERQHAEEAEKCRFWKGECDRFALTVGHLERTRCQMEAHTQELEKQQVEEAEKCHRLKDERDSALKKADNLQEQCDTLHRDIETLRKTLQNKTKLIQELRQYQEEIKAKLAATEQECDSTSLELVALRQEKGRVEEHMEATSQELMVSVSKCNKLEKQLEDARQCLKEKVEECKAFESTQLQLLPNMEDLKRENQQLAVKVMQKEAELATLEAERSALCGQLKDFAVIKAENESLKNDAEERTDMMRQCEDKSRRLARREERLNKERMDLTTERRLFMEQKKKLNTDFARSRNLESIVKRSVQESFELLNASGREMSESGSSEGSPDSALPESPIRRDMQNSDTVVEGKQEVEEAWRQEKREIQRQLDRARREIKQLKDAERKAQDSSEEMHELAQTYFQSHRYPPFLYQLHQLQKHLLSSGVQGISTLGDGRTVEVTRVTDLRSFTPYESWCDEFRSLIVKLKTMPSKQCQAYMLISFLHCGEVITFYRFHVALVPQVLSCERDLHPNELEGDAMPKAMLVYAHTELKSNNLKEFGITPHRKGVLLQPQCEGCVPELTRSQLLRKLKDTPAGLKHTEECLDANILHQLQRQYKEFAKPRTVHRVSPMSVAMALI